MNQDKKRELRQWKREIKRAGVKHRRRLLKRGLIDHPEEAHRDEPSVGIFRSDAWNGLDRRPEKPTDRGEASGSNGDD